MVARWPDVEPDPLYRAKFWEKAERHRGVRGLFGAAWMRAPAFGAIVSMMLLLGGIWSWQWSLSRSWESQAYQPWNSGTMAHISLPGASLDEPPAAAAAFFEERALVSLPEYVGESENEIYPELHIGKSSLAIMDDAYEFMGSMAGE